MKTHLKALKKQIKMHENENKCFSKTQVLNPSFPKIKIFNHSPFKKLKHKICFAQTKLKVVVNLVGQTEGHTQ